MHETSRNKQEHVRNMQELTEICMKYTGLNKNMHEINRNEQDHA